jgi:lipopolysaccharide export LptBFGC system permease protein LptF
MAWHDGTYSCGHQGRTQIYGKVSDRQYHADRHFDGICPDCLEESRKAAAKEALQNAEACGLPTLTGSEKQVAWAAQIRQEILAGKKTDGTQVTAGDYSIALKNTEAKWWIENRKMIKSDEYLLEEKIYELQRKASEGEIKTPTEKDEIVAIIRNDDYTYAQKIKAAEKYMANNADGEWNEKKEWNIYIVTDKNLEGGKILFREKKEVREIDLKISKMEWDKDWLSNYMPQNNEGADTLISVVAKKINKDEEEEKEEITLESAWASEIWQKHFFSWKVPACEKNMVGG